MLDAVQCFYIFGGGDCVGRGDFLGGNYWVLAGVSAGKNATSQKNATQAE